MQKQIKTITEDQHHRSLLKAVSWRITGTVDTIIISWIITGTLKMAVSIGFIEVFTKMILYYFHERAWNKVKFGRLIKTLDYQI